MGELRAAKISGVGGCSEATKCKTVPNGSSQHLRASRAFSKGELGRTIPAVVQACQKTPSGGIRPGQFPQAGLRSCIGENNSVFLSLWLLFVSCEDFVIYLLTISFPFHWILICSQSCETIITINFLTFLFFPKGNHSFPLSPEPITKLHQGGPVYLDACISSHQMAMFILL